MKQIEPQIDDVTYAIKEKNRYKTQSVKTQIIIGTSLRKDNYHIVRLQHKEFGNTKKWNTYTISREGVIYQHYDDKFHSDFLGIKEADKQSISIVLENMGCLFQAPSGKYINWLNEICDDDNVAEKNWLGYNFWENFPEKQMESVVFLCNKLCEKHNIPLKVVTFHHFHKDIIKYRGILFRSNYVEDSSDINPLFDIQKFNSLLLNDEIEIK